MRKIYDKLLAQAGICRKTALLIEGFVELEIYCCWKNPKNEYDSYILIDFSGIQKCPELWKMFPDLNYLFLQLQFQYRN